MIAVRACNALGIEELTGTIAAGRFADLVITHANPLDDIRTLSAPSTVVVRGHVMATRRSNGSLRSTR